MKRITEYDNITTVAESDVLPIVDVSDTEQASTGSTRKGSIEKIADYLKDRAETLTNKTLTSPTINAPIINNGSIGSGTNVVEVLKKVYPVGCIYISSVSTSPATLFGFGTWSLVGEGKALFGVDSGDGDFNASEKTGGAKTHTLTSAQMPEHTHVQNQHRHTYDKSNVASVNLQTGVSGINVFSGTTHSSTNSGYATPTNQNTGGGEAHSILNPYYTAYFYKRTA